MTMRFSFFCSFIFILLFSNIQGQDIPEDLQIKQDTLQSRIERLGETHLDVVAAYHDLELHYRQSGNFKKGLQANEAANKIQIELLGKNHLDVANFYNASSLYHKILGNYEKALEYNEKSLNIYLRQAEKNSTDIAKSYHNLAELLRLSGNYNEALESNMKALNIRVSQLEAPHVDLAKSYNNIAIVHMILGDYDKALKYIDQSLEMYIELFGDEHYEVAASYQNAALIAHYLDDYPRALELIGKTLEIKERDLGPEHFELAAVHNNLAVFHKNMGNLEKALLSNKKSLKIKEKHLSKHHPELATSYYNMSDVLRELGDLEQALDYNIKGHDIYSRQFPTHHDFVIDASVMLSKTYADMGNYELADSMLHIALPASIEQLNKNYLYLSAEQRIAYLDATLANRRYLYQYAAIHGNDKLYELVANLLLNTKSLALDYGRSVRSIINKTNDEQLIEQSNELQSISQKISDIELLPLEKRAEKGYDLETMQGERDELARKILQHEQLNSRLDNPIVQWQEIQQKLQPNEATIDFIHFYNEVDSTLLYYAVLIRPDLVAPKFIAIVNEKSLAPLFKIDEQNGRPNYTQNNRQRKLLYREVWQPLQPHLDGIDKIHLSTSGLLHKVDFGLLQNNSNEYLADFYRFRYYTDMRDFNKKESTLPTYKDAVLMGHILYDLKDKVNYQEEEESLAIGSSRNTRNKVEPLPETLKEVKTIGKICKKSKIKPTILTIDAATEDTVQYFTGKHAPDILHFATHGMFVEDDTTKNEPSVGIKDRLSLTKNPLQRSVLMLYGANHSWSKGEQINGSEEDGILTAQEVTLLNLSNTDLVVLSACNTGLGNIHNTEGVFGLQRAFKLAGADAILVSLWPVDDAITKDMMILFYTNLLKHKQDAATALYNTKTEMRERNELPHFWAGFILVE